MLPPLCIVIIVSMIKDAFEDFIRHRKDKEENYSKCSTMVNGVSIESKWCNLKVGQIVRINENEHFPADLVIIASSGVEGLCYVETKNLDGETNLKSKVAPK